MDYLAQPELSEGRRSLLDSNAAGGVAFLAGNCLKTMEDHVKEAVQSRSAGPSDHTCSHLAFLFQVVARVWIKV